MSSIFPNQPANSEFERISKELNKAQAELEDITLDYEDAETAFSVYEAEIKKAELALRKARESSYAAQEKKQGLLYNKNLVSGRVRDLKNQLYAAQREYIKREEWEKRSSKIDELARMFPWFPHIKKHQFEAAKEIVVTGGRTVVGDKRGLGKSLTALATADLLGGKRIVIISKGEILRNFENEIHKWYKDYPEKRPMLSIVSESKQMRDMIVDNVFPNAERFFLLINFEAWWRDKSLVQRVAKLQPDTIIIDEAHHAKEIEKNNFRGVTTIIYNKNKCPECGHNKITLFDAPVHWICEECRYVDTEDKFMSVKNVIPMTGSPIMNRPEEFFALLHMIDKVNFPSKKDFLYRYCQRVNYTNLMGRSATRWDFLPGGSSRLLESIGPQFIQRDRKSAGVEIPDQEIQYHILEFDKEKYPRQWQAYRELQMYMGGLFDKEGNGFVVARQPSTLITRYRQVISWPMGIKIEQEDEDGNKHVVFQCDVSESVKLDKAVELASELVGEGERVVIFSKFTAVLEELKRRFHDTMDTDEKIRAAIYYGNTSIHERDHIKRDFDISTYDPENYDYDVVLCQYQSAGEGLNFNSATQMIFIEREWNPEKEGQATGRIQRMGQDRETTVHVLELDNTIDVKIAKLLASKKDLVGDFESNAELVRQLIISEYRDS